MESVAMCHPGTVYNQKAYLEVLGGKKTDLSYFFKNYFIKYELQSILRGGSFHEKLELSCKIGLNKYYSRTIYRTKGSNH